MKLTFTKEKTMERHFVIEIETGNSCFEELPDESVKNVLAQVKSMIIGTKSLGKLYDINGNCVGKVEYK